MYESFLYGIFYLRISSFADTIKTEQNSFGIAIVEKPNSFRPVV